MPPAPTLFPLPMAVEWMPAPPWADSAPTAVAPSTAVGAPARPPKVVADRPFASAPNPAAVLQNNEASAPAPTAIASVPAAPPWQLAVLSRNVVGIVAPLPDWQPAIAVGAIPTTVPRQRPKPAIWRTYDGPHMTTSLVSSMWNRSAGEKAAGAPSTTTYE